MCGCSLDPTGADKIGEMLYHNNSITSLDLSDNYIRDRGVEKLVCHLNKSNHLQHLNLGSNEITEIGADHLRKLIAPDDTTLTSIELSDNPLGLQGVGIILNSLSNSVKHIGLRDIDEASYAFFLPVAALHHINSLSFKAPEDIKLAQFIQFIATEIVSDSTYIRAITGSGEPFQYWLRCTTLLKQLSLQIQCSTTFVNAITQVDSIEKLKLEYHCVDSMVADICNLLEHSKTLVNLMIIVFDRRSPELDILPIAKSLTVNKSLKTFYYGNRNLHQKITLEFLKQLTMEDSNTTVEYFLFGMSFEAYHDHRFLQCVEEYVQQINHNRSTKHMASLLKVEIQCVHMLY